MYSEQEGWPSQAQTLLLKAALLPRDEALHTWQIWQKQVNLDRLDAGSRRLLPLVYHNVRQHGLGAKHPFMQELRKQQRITLAKNKILFATMSAVLRQLYEAGFKTMILKGTALTVLYYQDYGLRPMFDFDVLIPTQQAHEAIEFLPRIGWKPVPRSPEKFTEHYIPIVHAHEFRNAKDEPFDLHWHVLEECCQADADQDFWDGAVPVQLDGVSTLALNATDQLFHACIHGFRWHPVPPMRWIADAMIILNYPDTKIDWERLVNQARKRHLIIPVRDALTYLRTTFAASIPLDVLQQLQQLPTSRLEAVEYRYKRQNFRHKPLGYLVIMWFNYARWTPQRTFFSRLFGFFDYMRRFWGLEHFWQFPKYIGIMLIRRIREFFS